MTPGRTLWSRGQKVDNYANVATGERAGSRAGMCDDGPGDIFISCVTWNTLYSYLMAHGGPCIHISWSTHGGPCGNRSFPLLLNLNYSPSFCFIFTVLLQLLLRTNVSHLLLPLDISLIQGTGECRG